MTQLERERNAKRVRQYLESLIKAAAKVRELSLKSCTIVERNVPKDKRIKVASISQFSTGPDNGFELHIYSGLQAMADLLDLPVTSDFNEFADKVVLSFEYKGCRVFQLGYDSEK